MVATGPVVTSRMPELAGPPWDGKVANRVSLTRFPWSSVVRKIVFLTLFLRNLSSLARSKA